MLALLRCHKEMAKALRPPRTGTRKEYRRHSSYVNAVFQPCLPSADALPHRSRGYLQLSWEQRAINSIYCDKAVCSAGSELVQESLARRGHLLQAHPGLFQRRRPTCPPDLGCGTQLPVPAVIALGSFTQATRRLLTPLSTQKAHCGVLLAVGCTLQGAVMPSSI